MHRLALSTAGIDQILVTVNGRVLFITKVIDMLVYQWHADIISAPPDKCDIDQHNKPLCADLVY